MSKNWLRIVLVILIAVAAFGFGRWFLFSETALYDEISRSPVPGTNLELVLYKDEKHLSRYRILADGNRASELRMLGGLGDITSATSVERKGQSVILSWSSQSGREFVEIDLTDCLILRDSNGSGSPTRIENCHRTE